MKRYSSVIDVCYISIKKHFWMRQSALAIISILQNSLFTQSRQQRQKIVINKFYFVYCGVKFLFYYFQIIKAVFRASFLELNLLSCFSQLKSTKVALVN